MKNLIRTLLVCLISASNSIACGWYPFGEEVRFSLMNPAIFDDGGMSPYYYTSWSYGYNFTSTPENDPNIVLWSDYCKEKVDAQSIFEAIYELHEDEITSRNSTNKMVVYLRENDSEALDYIGFAKSCSPLNKSYSSWEDEEDNVYLTRSEKMLEALKRSEKVASSTIKKRYRFLALRLAFYGGDESKLRAIHKKSFPKVPTDAIDYWALYFKSTTDENSAERNYNLAQVFVNAPGKRFGALTHLSREIPMEEVLKFASTNTERANVYLMYAVREKGRNLSMLKKVHELDPTHPLLDYLLIREVNKLEDWILTPYYTNFEPTVDARRDRYSSESNDLIQERIKDDEKYAREVEEWISSVRKKGSNTWLLAEAYLKGITGNEREALTLLKKISNHSEEIQVLIDQIKLLFKVRFNVEKALTMEEQNLLMNSEQDDYNLFLFAVSREYEFQQKMDIAAGLFSHVNNGTSYGDVVSWKSSTGKETLSSDYFYSWFLYLDAEYTPKEVQSVIEFAAIEFTESKSFDRWQRKYLLENMDKLYDLLGTKYIRENNLDQAIAAFEKVGGSLWEKNPYTSCLNANPFHADFYSGHKPSKLDTVSYTKLEIAKLYKSYLQKAQNPKTKNRAYYYFLIANCELNMSHYGNSWMMRRYYWTAAMNPNYLVDDDDYFRLKRARAFYQKAFDVSSEKEVKALCLRMIGRCEKHQLYFDAPNSWDFDYDPHGGKSNYVYSMNQSYEKLKKEYPNDADELLSNCFSFERYFAKLEN